MKYESGRLPTFSDLKEFIKEPSKSKESWSLMKEMPAEVILKENLSKPLGTNRNSLNVKTLVMSVHDIANSVTTQCLVAFTQNQETDFDNVNRIGF